MISRGARSRRDGRSLILPFAVLLDSRASGELLAFGTTTCSR
jgi:hypothetical protein